MTADLAAGPITSLPWQRGRRQPLSLLLLYALWAVVLTGLGAGAAVLQFLGPPGVVQDAPFVAAQDHHAPPAEAMSKAEATSKAAALTTTAPAPHAAHAPAAAEPAPHGFTPALPAVAPVVPPPPPATRPPGTIAEPEPGLQEASLLNPGAKLPRIGADRRMPMQVFASPFDLTSRPPRVSVLLSGLGMNEADTLAAIDSLPAPVSLAFSPYAYRPEVMLSAARARGHEYLVSVPMEPLGYPLNDPGNRALLTGAPMATNAQRLDWVLSRFPGYVGATGALGDLRGERFAAATDQMAPVLDTLADRGLLYVDPRPNVARLSGSPAQRGAGRGVDVVLDDPSGRAEIDEKLARLEQLARDRGAAIGLAGRPTPLLISRIAAWATTLASHGVVLAPVSVVVQMPQAAGDTSATAVRTNLLR